MTTTIQPVKPVSQVDQQLSLPYPMTWQQFETLESLISTYCVRVSYLDGSVEIMTLSHDHELIKCLLGLLLGIFFVEKDIDFTPTGSATLRTEEKGSSKEPDLSYRFGKDRRQRQVPDLVVEVIMTSGGFSKLEYYRRFQVREVWFWEDGVFSQYQLGENGYEPINQSALLPELDMTLLVRCLQMSEEKEAIAQFRDAIRCENA